MEIYGLGLVALCMFVGSYLGRLLAMLVGVSGDVGGVGFATLMLVLICNHFKTKGKSLSAATGNGVKFLGAIYIPIVVAMSANQNVLGALSGGVIAIAAGALATLLSLLLVPVIADLGRKKV